MAISKRRAINGTARRNSAVKAPIARSRSRSAASGIRSTPRSKRPPAPSSATCAITFAIRGYEHRRAAPRCELHRSAQRGGPPMIARAATAPLDLFACKLEGTTLVEASAGTGKTWNICGLYLRLLLERQLDVREILVVTFTNAATAEL